MTDINNTTSGNVSDGDRRSESWVIDTVVAQIRSRSDITLSDNIVATVAAATYAVMHDTYYTTSMFPDADTPDDDAGSGNSPRLNESAHEANLMGHPDLVASILADKADPTRLVRRPRELRDTDTTTPDPASSPVVACDECDRPAIWVYIGESGDMYRCRSHAPESLTGWRPTPPASTPIYVCGCERGGRRRLCAFHEMEIQPRQESRLRYVVTPARAQVIRELAESIRNDKANPETLVRRTLPDCDCACHRLNSEKITADCPCSRQDHSETTT